MPEYGASDLAAASAMTAVLMHQVRTARDLVRDRLDPGGLYRFIVLEAADVFTADVESALERFTVQYLTSESIGIPMWCVKTASGLVPVDLASGWNLSPWPPHFETYRLAAIYLESTFRERLPLAQTAPSEALEALENAVREFLAVRFSARRSNISQDPGLQFEVSTDSSDLRVHYSPAYFLNMNNVFGSPTPTVRQWIQPGRYVFGAVGRHTKLHFDLGSHYDIPPLTQAHLYI